jgi:hypothetical protein
MYFKEILTTTLISLVITGAVAAGGYFYLDAEIEELELDITQVSSQLTLNQADLGATQIMIEELQEEIKTLSEEKEAQAEEEAAKTQTSTYNWEAQAISFDYPAELNALTLGGDRIFITHLDVLPEGDGIPGATIHVYIGGTLQNRIDLYSTESGFTQSEETVSGRTFTKINYIGSMGDVPVTVYLTPQADTRIVEFSANDAEIEELKDLVLGSLKLEL